MSYESSDESEGEAEHLPKWRTGLVAEWGDQQVAENQIESEQARKRAHRSKKDGLHELAAAHDPIGSPHALCRDRAGQVRLHEVDDRSGHHEAGSSDQ